MNVGRRLQGRKSPGEELEEWRGTRMLPVPKNDRETYIQIRDVARRFADEAIRPKAEELDREERFPGEIYQRMGELGLFGITVPAESGGVGLDSYAYAIVMEELSRGYASIADQCGVVRIDRHAAHPLRLGEATGRMAAGDVDGQDDRRLLHLRSRGGFGRLRHKDHSRAGCGRVAPRMAPRPGFTMLRSPASASSSLVPTRQRARAACRSSSFPST